MPQATTHSTSFHDGALKMERRAAKREVISWTMRGGEGRPLYAIQPYGVRAILLYESDFSGILPVILKNFMASGSVFGRLYALCCKGTHVI